MADHQALPPPALHLPANSLHPIPPDGHVSSSGVTLDYSRVEAMRAQFLDQVVDDDRRHRSFRQTAVKTPAELARSLPNIAEEGAANDDWVVADRHDEQAQRNSLLDLSVHTLDRRVGPRVTSLPSGANTRLQPHSVAGGMLLTAVKTDDGQLTTMRSGVTPQTSPRPPSGLTAPSSTRTRRYRLAPSTRRPP